MNKFLLKWLINGAIIVAFLMYYSDASLLGAAIAATGLTIIAYLVGDQLILRNTNNLFATICDFVLTVIYFGAVSYILDWKLSWGETMFLALLVGAGEWVMHRYVFHEEPQTA